MSTQKLNRVSRSSLMPSDFLFIFLALIWELGSMAITSIEVLDFRRYGGPTVLVAKFSQSNHFVPILPKLRSISSPPHPYLNNWGLQEYCYCCCCIRFTNSCPFVKLRISTSIISITKI